MTSNRGGSKYAVAGTQVCPVRPTDSSVYDRWCKYLNNLIGLLNHREFVITLGGLTSIAVLDIVVDGIDNNAKHSNARKAQNGPVEVTQRNIILGLHLMYCLILLKTVLPIL